MIEYKKIEDNYYWLDSALEFMKNNTLYNIYFCNDIFNFNKYLEDISTMTIKNKVFKTTTKAAPQQRGGRRTTRRKTKNRKTKNRKTKNRKTKQ